MHDSDVVSLYLNKKLSCADIAVEDGRSESTIYKILLKNKVQMRNKSEANQIFDDCLLRFMYNLGLSLSQIAEVLGIDATTISKRFTLIGFPTRIPCQAKGVRYTKEEFKRFFMNDRFKKLIKEVN
jgi:DNA-binding CsgD family transcriptional regulator